MTIKNPKFHGLTDDQVHQILTSIAGQACLMADICREKAADAGDTDTANVFHALDTMISSLGALADMPLGGSVVGCFTDWMVGPLFNREQDAIQAEA